MELKDIIKAVEDKELGSDVIAAIKSLDQSGEVERLKADLTAEQGKNGGILDDKKKYKERAETAEATIKKAADEKLPADEKHKQEIADLKKQFEDSETQRTNEKADLAKSQRANKILELTGKINWGKLPKETARLAVKNAMADVDDLSDKSKVEEVMKGVSEAHKDFIVAETPGGTGGEGGGGGGGGGDDKDKVYTLNDGVKDAWDKTK